MLKLIDNLLIAGSEDKWKLAYIVSERTRYTKYSTNFSRKILNLMKEERMLKFVKQIEVNLSI